MTFFQLLLRNLVYQWRGNLAVLLQEAGNPIGALRAYERASQLGDAQVSDMARAAAQELKTQLRPTASAATEVAHPSIPGSQ